MNLASNLFTRQTLDLNGNRLIVAGDVQVGAYSGNHHVHGATVQQSVDGMIHAYEDGRVIWVSGTGAGDVVFVDASVGGDVVLRARRPPGF